MAEEGFMRLETKNEALFLNGEQLKGVERFEIKTSSDLPKGKAELVLKLIVEFPDNMQERSLLRAETESE